MIMPEKGDRVFTYLKHHPHEIILGFLLILGAFMRFIHFNEFSLSNDELSALNRVRYDSFSELVEKGFYVDGHPGGIQVLLYYWVKLFGMSVTAVRLPFVIFGLLAIYFAYKTAAFWFNKTSALFVAVVITVFELPLLFSLIARPYGSGMFFSLLMVYYWSRMVFETDDSKSRYKMAAGYILGTALCLYNHYFSFLVALIVGATGLVIIPRERLRVYLFSALIVVVLFIPHIPVTINHLSIGGVGNWLGKPGWKWPLEHLFHLVNNSVLLACVTITIFIIHLMVRRKIPGFSKKRLILILWFLLPLLIGFFYSRWYNPVLQHKVLIFSFPFIFMFLFSFANTKLGWLNGSLLVLLFLSGIYSTVGGNSFYKSQHFGEFEDIGRNITKWNRQLGEENITRIISVNHPFYINYYLERFGNKTEFVQWNIRNNKDIQELVHILDTVKTSYFMVAATKPVPHEVDHLVHQKYPCLVYLNTYQGRSRISLFAKNEMADSCKELTDPVLKVEKSFEDSMQLEGKAMKLRSDSVAYEGKYSLQMDKRDFGPAIEYSLPTGSRNYSRILAEVQVFSADTLHHGHLVLSITDEKGEGIFWRSSPFEIYTLAGQWSPVIIDKPLPVSSKQQYKVKVYIWGHKEESFFFDNFNVYFY